MRHALARPLMVVTLSLVGGATAQTKTFSADTLERQAQQVVASPGFVTVIEFSQDVTPVASGQGKLLQLEKKGPRLYLSAAASSGTTDLVVEVGGRTLLFTVTIKPGTGTRRYLVLPGKPGAAEAAPKPPASAAVTPPRSAPVATPAPAPVTAAPAAPASAPAKTSQLLQDIRQRLQQRLAQTPAPTGPAQTTPAPARLAAPPVQPSAGAGRLLWADFEQVKNGRPSSAKGGFAFLAGVQQNPDPPAKYSGAGQREAPLLLLPAQGNQSQRAYFDYDLPAGNPWSLVQAFVYGLPTGPDGQAPGQDVRGYSALSIDLAVTGVTEMHIGLVGRDETRAGREALLKVGPNMTTYRIPLNTFKVPDWAKASVPEAKLSPEAVLGKLQFITVQTAAGASVGGRVVIDNIVFVK